ncbi:hypothetical protein [Desulfosporosinus sp. BICA1-9]|uniref:hypothetical protein n=1 Tax=Desulfosporosinus sp. BICA1-9 TaxID=1531958 RepID=UPI000AB9D3CB|nr:hypothetical protein [Desulfosporosinus sp. BICA1-9]KJS90574.1 MAG: hypothetical protein JL57_01060 [Desulfosporosinus sp. BICA1-9]
MDNEKFQEFIANQFTKLFSEFKGLKQDFSELKADVSELKADVSELKADVSELKADVSELRNSQVRMEAEFHNQITALHDFRVGQERVNQEVKNELLILGTKMGELQMETAHLRVVK